MTCFVVLYHVNREFYPATYTSLVLGASAEDALETFVEREGPRAVPIGIGKLGNNTAQGGESFWAIGENIVPRYLVSERWEA